MDWTKESMTSFLEYVQNMKGDEEPGPYNPEFVNEFPLNRLECLYVFEFKTNRIIQHRGFDQTFGYRLNEMSLDFIFDKYHPDDAPLVKGIVKGCVSQFIEKPIPPMTNLLNVSYRFRRADGSYADILSNTIVLQSDSEGRVERVLMRYTDISFTHSSDAVDWMVNENFIRTEPIHQALYGAESSSFFTARELEVIALAERSMSNAQIARKLFISPHTVATHRKNILFKSGCTNFKELSDFCRAKGISIEQRDQL
jgi:DNA-binding CsgD family transcriptional regulator